MDEQPQAADPTPVEAEATPPPTVAEPTPPAATTEPGPAVETVTPTHSAATTEAGSAVEVVEPTLPFAPLPTALPPPALLPPPTPPVLRLERTDMAWPPAAWERAAGAWRDDVWTGPPIFQPFDAPAAAPAPPAAAPAAGGRHLAREAIETALLTLLIFLAIKLVVQNFRIQGASMEPTLHDGQFLLVNRLPHYGIGEPGRGDIVVFKAWEQGAGPEEKDFIKRVVGLPGDKVEIRDNQVMVNDQVLQEPYLEGNATTDRIGPITLGQEEYYVMGDNRGNSSDSRTYGPLPQDRIIGKAWLSYWPLENIGVIPDSSSSFAHPRGG
jgi:signal peptidase I